MKKLVFCFVALFCIASCAMSKAVSNDELIKLEQNFNKMAQRFAYQEHFLLDPRVEMCNELIDIFKEVTKEDDSSHTQELKSKIQYLVKKPDTCSSKTYGGVYNFPFVEKIIKFHKNTGFHTDSCEELKKSKSIDWLSVYMYTEEHSIQNCKKAWDLVEPHYSEAYKMRNWE
jgi:hypothetical protein